MSPKISNLESEWGLQVEHDAYPGLYHIINAVIFLVFLLVFLSEIGFLAEFRNNSAGTGKN